MLDEIEQSALLARVNEIGEWFGGELQKLRTRMPSIVEVRGRGMMWGIELDRPAKEIATALMAKGFVVGTARDNVIRLLPPYITPKKAFVDFVAVLEEVLVEDSGPPLSRQPGAAVLHTQIAQGAISK